MNHHIVDKEFRDFADDIEGVSIHYLCAPVGAEANWNRDRVTRFMPLVEPGVRRLKLKLPSQIVEPHTGRPTSHYTLFHYFEIFRGGDRHYSQIYTEMIDTGAKETAADDTSPIRRPASRRSRKIQ
jgi:hypothetical protein